MMAKVRGKGAGATKGSRKLSWRESIVNVRKFWLSWDNLTWELCFFGLMEWA